MQKNSLLGQINNLPFRRVISDVLKAVTRTTPGQRCPTVRNRYHFDISVCFKKVEMVSSLVMHSYEPCINSSMQRSPAADPNCRPMQCLF